MPDWVIWLGILWLLANFVALLVFFFRYQDAKSRDAQAKADEEDKAVAELRADLDVYGPAAFKRRRYYRGENGGEDHRS